MLSPAGSNGATSGLPGVVDSSVWSPPQSGGVVIGGRSPWPNVGVEPAGVVGDTAIGVGGDLGVRTSGDPCAGLPDVPGLAAHGVVGAGASGIAGTLGAFAIYLPDDIGVGSLAAPALAATPVDVTVGGTGAGVPGAKGGRHNRSA